MEEFLEFMDHTGPSGEFSVEILDMWRRIFDDLIKRESMKLSVEPGQFPHKRGLKEKRLYLYRQ